MNHNIPLSDFQEYLDLLTTSGYKPLAVSQIYLEYTFVFETKEEALKAYHQFERSEEGKWIGEIAGWWYGKEDFLATIQDYESKFNTKVLVHWL